MYGLFYNRKATIYKPVRDETTMITSRQERATIKCALQCLYGDDQWERRGRELNRVYRAYRFFSDYLEVEIWDKIIIDWVDYICNSMNIYKGTFRTFAKGYFIKWEWD